MNYFTGPHFQPWNRMGNIKGWGGPITLTYLWNDLQLNKKVFIILSFNIKYLMIRLLIVRFLSVCFLFSLHSLDMFLMNSLYLDIGN